MIDRKLKHYMLAGFLEFELHLDKYQRKFIEDIRLGNPIPLDRSELDDIIRMYSCDTLTLTKIREYLKNKNLSVLRTIGSSINERRENYFFQSTVIKKIDDEIYTNYVLNPEWINSHTRGLATDIYSELANNRKFCPLYGVLGDCFEDIGCIDRVILEHCREDIYHCQGCWLIEALLGY